MTLPLCIFFRFHAAVFSIELWKEYSGKDDNAKEAVKLWKAFAGKKSVVEDEDEDEEEGGEGEGTAEEETKSA